MYNYLLFYLVKTLFGENHHENLFRDLLLVIMNEIERCLLVKQEVFVYKIPPRQSARGYRAADWSLTSPDWTGRLRIMEANKKVGVIIFVKLKKLQKTLETLLFELLAKSKFLFIVGEVKTGGQGLW